MTEIERWAVWILAAFLALAIVILAKVGDRVHHLLNARDDLLDALDEANRRLDRAREALQPFADALRGWDEKLQPWEDEDSDDPYEDMTALADVGAEAGLVLADLRRAAEWVVTGEGCPSGEAASVSALSARPSEGL